MQRRQASAVVQPVEKGGVAPVPFEPARSRVRSVPENDGPAVSLKTGGRGGRDVRSHRPSCADRLDGRARNVRVGLPIAATNPDAADTLALDDHRETAL